MVTACGQKGPLYLPDDTAAAKKYDIKEKKEKPAEK